MKLFLISYMVLINLLALALMGIDKWKARRGRWRISEKTLFLAAIFGGSIGSLARNVICSGTRQSTCVLPSASR